MAGTVGLVSRLGPTWVRVVLVGALVVSTAASGAAAGVPARRAGKAGSLVFAMSIALHNSGTTCPAGVPLTTECFMIQGESSVPGLGSVSENYLAMDDQSNRSCRRTSWSQVVLSVAGKGTIDATLAASGCDASQNAIGNATFTVTGGTERYAGASGSGTENASDLTRDAWSGTLTVSGLTFDTAPPVIHGAVSKTVRVRKSTRRVRVSYKVSAGDAVDGTVEVSCTPRSGTWFRLGRTRVGCSATDSSANTATAAFVITVKRR